MLRSPAFGRRPFLGAAAVAASGLRPARAQTLTHINFQLSWLYSIQYGGYFAGIEHGTFKAAGLDVTLTPGGPNIDTIANVTSGRAQMGDRPAGPVIVAREKGFPIKIIGVLFQKSAFSIISLASKPIRTLQELKGKTVAVAPTARPTMTTLFREHGVDPDSVTMVPAAPDSFGLVSGQIDAYTGWSTNQGTMLEARGIPIVALNLYDLGIPEPSSVIYAREDYLAANRPAVVAFLRAASQSWRWALDHPEEDATLTVDKFGNGSLDPKAMLMELKASAPFIEAGVGTTRGLLSVDVAAVQKTLDLYLKTGVLKAPMHATDLCDASFVDAAHTA